jgi:hypothetical protein
MAGRSRRAYLRAVKSYARVFDLELQRLEGTRYYDLSDEDGWVYQRSTASGIEAYLDRLALARAIVLWGASFIFLPHTNGGSDVEKEKERGGAG